MSDASPGTSQKVDQAWATPSADEIVSLTAAHVEAMETMDIDEVWLQAGMHHLMLRTVGRKSAKVHKVALPFWRDPDGHRIVVASFAGAAKDPSWFVNLADRAANPEVYVKVQRGEFWSVPEILDGDDYSQTWTGLVADRAWYTDYQAKTSRRIPLVRLPETRAV
ncbi:MAG: nitroreductase/quinone reductase family protein [Actinomycetota bacterium]